MILLTVLKFENRISGNSLARTLHFYCRGPGFNSWLGNQESRKPCSAAEGRKEGREGGREGGRKERKKEDRIRAFM